MGIRLRHPTWNTSIYSFFQRHKAQLLKLAAGLPKHYLMTKGNGIAKDWRGRDMWWFLIVFANTSKLY
jgi:hypothetical protein